MQAGESTMRVCVIGAECTGKTTLAHELGEHYKAPVVEEYGREYFCEKLARGDASVFTGDLVRVVAEQSRREDAVWRSAGPLMICDTDVLTVAIWHERYLGGRRPEIDQLAQMRIDQGAGMDLYLLCEPDFEFVPDEIRTGEPLRHAMQEVFEARLREWGRPFVHISGSPEIRLATAIAAIDAALTTKESR